MVSINVSTGFRPLGHDIRAVDQDIPQACLVDGALRHLEREASDSQGIQSRILHVRHDNDDSQVM